MFKGKFDVITLLGEREDIPAGVGKFFEKNDISDRLPWSISGYELISFLPKTTRADPVVLRNRWHQIIYQWPDDYIPGWVDVLKVCKGLEIA